jgi:deferrochelatase/peroxidase EfeB
VKRRTLQAGIYFEENATPHPYYLLLLLNAFPGVNRSKVLEALGALMRMLADLTNGRVRGLEGQPSANVAESVTQYGSLDVLFGYGRRFFDQHQHAPPLTNAPRPDFLSYLPEEGPFPAVAWASVRRNAEADFALQLTGAAEATVTCAAIEVWKLIRERQLPLAVVESFGGYGRPDRRGWLGFHDGISNMGSNQRLSALVSAGDPDWMCGGTYMAYLRIRVDLALWESRSREEQELIVGRDKLTGAALVAIEFVKGRPVPVAAAAPGAQASAEEKAAWRDPPQTTDAILEASHIARANQTRASPSAPGAFRIFRQGYDFLESLDAAGADLGLNFVSFQRDLRVLQQLLHLPGWLGDANFGGRGEETSMPLLSVCAGGFYAVPRRARPFAGAELFRDA